MVLYCSWNGVDARAFTPTADMLLSPDVIETGPAGVHATSSPFSLGVYGVDHESLGAQERDNTAFRPLQLLYVSEVVAADRALTSPRMERYVQLYYALPPFPASLRPSPFVGTSH
jgi:hypothetical protein